MSELISKDAALDCFCDWIDRYGNEHTADEDATYQRIAELPAAQPETHWIPCSERLPEEDHWLGGSGRQFSDEVLVSVVNYDDEDTWVYISQTIDGKWALELPRHCEITAWRPLPEPYRGGEK